MRPFDREMSVPRAPSVGGPASLADWRLELASFLGSRPRLAEVGPWLGRHLPELATAFGRFPPLLRSALPHSGERRTAERDVLPISREAVLALKEDEVVALLEAERLDHPWDEGVREWCGLIVDVLNFFYCAGFTGVSVCNAHRAELGTVQLEAVAHIASSVARFLAATSTCPPLSDLNEKLETVEGDYHSGPVLAKMYPLTAEKVVPAWPAVDKAAIQPVVDFLEGVPKKMVKDPYLNVRDKAQWPTKTRKSYVRASQEDWNEVVAAAYARSMMAVVPEDLVFRGVGGEPVYNGAGGVSKVKFKDGRRLELLRFISIFCPINEYLTRIEGDDDKLPYVGQVTLVLLEDGQEVLVDSEDFESCFNLFSLPDEWLGFFSYEKQVPGYVMGKPEIPWVRPALRVIPMGWVSAVAVMQAVVRRIVFGLSAINPKTEVQKALPMPEGDELSILYLDSFDRLRTVSSAVGHATEGEETEEHANFVKVCEGLNLPLNTGKSLVGAVAGSLQGGRLDGRRGLFGVAPEKSQEMVWLGLLLLSRERWSVGPVRHWAGKACFAAVFRRPLFSVLQEIFWQVQELDKKEASPWGSVFDEVLCFTILLPMAFTNLRAPIDEVISCSDASLGGGGVAIASHFRPPAETELRGASSKSKAKPKPAETCGVCGSSFTSPGASSSAREAPLTGFGVSPSRCGAKFCSVTCAAAHSEGSC